MKRDGMADQSEGIVQAYAEHLARKAGSVVVTFAVGGTVAGAALALIASKMPGGLINPGVRNFAILLGAIAGGFLGRSIGDKKAAVFKLQAGLALHQAQLAQKLAGRPAAQAPVPQAPVPHVPVAQAVPAAPAPVAPAPVAPAPVAPAPVAVPPAPAPTAVAPVAPAPAPAMAPAPPALVSPEPYQPAPVAPAPLAAAPPPEPVTTHVQLTV